MLTHEQELELFRRYKQEGDLTALDEIVHSHLRLISKIYWKESLRSRERAEDVIQEASIALMYAADKFEPERGWRFSTYANWWVRASAQTYNMQNRTLIHTPSTAAAKNFMIRRQLILDRLKEGHYSEETYTKIATELKINMLTLKSLVAIFSTTMDMVSLDAPISSKLEADGVSTFSDVTPDPTALEHVENLETDDLHDKRRHAFQGALLLLDPRARHIIEGRFSDPPATLQEMADIYGISRERVRQIEEKATKKITAYLQRHYKHLNASVNHD